MLSESSTRQPGDDSAIRTLGSFSIINEIHDSSPKAALIEFPVPSLQHPALESRLEHDFTVAAKRSIR